MTRVSSREGSSLYVLGTEEIHREPRTLVTETIQSPPGRGRETLTGTGCSHTSQAPGASLARTGNG